MLEVTSLYAWIPWFVLIFDVKVLCRHRSGLDVVVYEELVSKL